MCVRVKATSALLNVDEESYGRDKCVIQTKGHDLEHVQLERWRTEGGKRHVGEGNPPDTRCTGIHFTHNLFSSQDTAASAGIEEQSNVFLSIGLSWSRKNLHEVSMLEGDKCERVSFRQNNSEKHGRDYSARGENGKRKLNRKQFAASHSLYPE